MKRPVLLCVLSGLAACDGQSVKLGGILATLRFGATAAQCARIYATAQDEKHQAQSGPVQRQNRDLFIGIAQSEQLGQVVTLEAHGYANNICTGPWDDDSNVVTATFPVGMVDGGVLLLLDGRPMNNTDGGSAEQCNDGVDDNHDGLTDCQDPACDLQSCGAGGYYCISQACVIPPAEVNCSDGRDDDLNGKTDCLDSACENKACLGTGDVCMTFTCGGGTCGGAPVMCTTPGVCQQANSGMCVPGDGGCSYAPVTGGACGDGGTCVAGACSLSLPFTPSSGVPRDVPDSEVGGDLMLDCATSFNTDTLAFTNLCAGQTAPPAWLVGNIAVLGMRSLNVTMNGVLTVTGSRALVLLVLGDATLAGKISADAVLDVAGPGAATNCVAGTGLAGTAATGSGGGGGGHSTAGGLGGDGPQNNATGGVSGDIEPDDTLQPLRGGCVGGPGRLPSGGAGAAGGGGGGALQLTVGGTLHLTSGKLSVAGGGGRAGLANAGGGGGGGSGGGILLEATTIVLDNGARLLANGGGGGGGADDNTVGQDGDNGHPMDTNAAHGGDAGGNRAGNGGDSASGGNHGRDGDSGDSSNGKSGGGGGGGGGLGRIVIAHGDCTQAQNFKSAPDVDMNACPQP